jgi:uncharacterized protein YlxP (DUF503 family)
MEAKMKIALFTPLLLCLLVSISCSGEKKDWKNAQSENSITAYEDYLKQYPQGEFADEARSQIETIHFEKAETANTIEAYADFLERYPQGELADRVRSTVQGIHFDKAKATNSVESYQDFLDKYPEGEIADQARKMLEEIYPSFSSQKVLRIESASSVVGTGEVSFTKGSKSNTLKITINVTAPVVNGKTCMGCGSLVQLAPNLKVPVKPFFTPMKQPGQSVSFINMVLEGPTSAEAAEFIVSGPPGATLKKEGNGFRLVKGEAHFLKKKEQN